MQEITVPLQKGIFRGICFGAGPQLIIALHGFGDNSGLFRRLEKHLEKSFTIYAVDLPFHGGTTWHADRYDAADIEDLVSKILEREEKTSFSWLGFSFGGRIALSTLDRFAGRLESMYLIAPDGLGTRGMRFPLLFPLPVRRWGARVLHHPEWLLSLAARLHQWKLLDTSRLRFLQYHLVDKQRRIQLLHTWLSLGNFRISRDRLKRQLHRAGIPVYLFLGQSDPLIPLPPFEQLADKLANVHLFLLEGDHDQLINRKLAQIIRRIRKSKSG